MSKLLKFNEFISESKMLDEILDKMLDDIKITKKEQVVNFF